MSDPRAEIHQVIEDAGRKLREITIRGVDQLAGQGDRDLVAMLERVHADYWAVAAMGRRDLEEILREQVEAIASIGKARISDTGYQVLAAITEAAGQALRIGIGVARSQIGG